MHCRSGGTSYNDGHSQPFALEELAQLFHLLQRWGDESAEAHQTGLSLKCLFQDGFVGHHHAQINHIETVTAQHDAYDILADVVYIAIGGGQHHARAFRLLRALFFIDVRLQQSDGILHDLS